MKMTFVIQRLLDEKSNVWMDIERIRVNSIFIKRKSDFYALKMLEKHQAEDETGTYRLITLLEDIP